VLMTKLQFHAVACPDPQNKAGLLQVCQDVGLSIAFARGHCNSSSDAKGA